MKQFILSGATVLTFVVYSIHQHLNLSESAGIVIPETSPANLPTPTSATSGQISTPEQGNPAPKTTGIYHDGSYTGVVADAFYGNVQVKAVIQNGRLSDVQFLDYPRDRRTSEQISAFSTPYLRSEAIAAQSAQVDIVSGATQTSRAFIESLTSALLQAKNPT